MTQPKPNKDQILALVHTITIDLDIWLEVSAPDSQGVQTLLFPNWETLGQINDGLNTELCEGWASIRKRYMYAHGLKRCIDIMHNPRAHRSNLGQVGGAFASLPTLGGRLSAYAILTYSGGRTLPYAVVDVQEIEGLNIAFTDQCRVCSDCSQLIDITAEEYAHTSNGETCITCIKSQGLTTTKEYLKLWELPESQHYVLGDTIEDEQASDTCDLCKEPSYIEYNDATELNVMEHATTITTKSVCHDCVCFHANAELPERVIPTENQP